MNPIRPPLRASDKRGIALPATLVMLLVLTLLGLAAMNGDVVQERIVGNTKDTNLAFQAAEAALRDAEADIAANLNAASGFGPGCPSGLCTPPSTWSSGASSAALWSLASWTDPTKTRSYGQYTNATPVPDVSQQPEYIVEFLDRGQPVGGDSASLGLNPSNTATHYRITVYAWGARPETNVIVQSTYEQR